MARYDYGMGAIPDGTADQPDDESMAQKQDNPQQASSPSTPTPYKAPSPTAPDAATPVPSFAQMQAAGDARPPAPDPGAPPAGAGQGSSAMLPPTPIAPPSAPVSTPGATTAGMTEQQLQQYWGAQGVPVSGAYNASYGQAGQPAAGTADPAKLAALTAGANADPLVAEQLARLKTGPVGPQYRDPATGRDVSQAEGEASLAANAARDRAVAAQSAIRAGGLFTDNLDPNTAYANNGVPMQFGSVSDYIANATNPQANPAATPGEPTTYTGQRAANPILDNPGPATSLQNGVLSGATGQPATPTQGQPGYTTNSGPAAASGLTPSTPHTGGTPTGTGTAPVTGSTPGGSTSAAPGFDILNSLVTGAQGNGAGAAVQNATQANTLNLLAHPNAYGTADVQREYDNLGGQIDDQYRLNQNAIGEDSARRGLGNSTINAGRLNDLNIGQRSAKTQLASDLASKYADTQNSANLAAIGAGNTVGTTAQNNSQSWLNNLIGYGQQGFNNDVTTNAANQNETDSYRNFILGLLGYGQGAGA